MFIVTLLEACLTFVRRRCFRALYGAGVGKSRRRPRAPAPDTAPQTTPTPALPVIIHKHYVIGPETPGDATPRPPEQSGAQRTIFAAPQSETLSAWERLADDDEPFDDGEPLDDLPDDVTEQERAERCKHGSEASSWKPTVEIRQGTGFLAYVSRRNISSSSPPGCSRRCC